MLTDTPAARARPGQAARPVAREIQALRALAVALVIAYHLWPGAVRGGFIGVDVFFAVSGFLITGHLVRDIERTGRIRLASFWAARAKRLLPAALLTLAVVAIGVAVFMPPTRWRQSFTEIRASALYVQNWRLAADAVDYLAAGNAPSPVQHFWTLSVEEQFYIALPLLLMACLLLGARRASWLRRRRSMAALIGAITLASAGYSLYLTAVAAPVAYFSTLTRAWEFAAGGLLAFLARERGRAPGAASPPLIRAAVSWGGTALILLAGFGFSAATPFPSLTAALPVVGALAVIWAGWRPGRAGTAIWMKWRGVQRLGDVSYSAYLWHWPLIVLAPYALGRPVAAVEKVAILLAALAIAWLSWRFVENPVRYSPRLLGSARPRLIAAWSAAGMAVVIVGASLGAPAGEQVITRALDHARSMADARTPCFGAAAPVVARAGAPVRCENRTLAGVLAPDPAFADQDALGRPDCWDSTGSDTLKRCTFGPRTGYTKRIAVIGDSHANQHATAFIEVASQRGWQVQIMGKNGCYLTDAVEVRTVRALEDQCESWKTKVRAFLASERFDAIVVTHAADSPVHAPEGVPQDEAIVSGIVTEWSALTAAGQRIIALRDNPIARSDITDCVREHREDPAACSLPRGKALKDTETQAAAARVPGVQVVDLSDRYCDQATCFPVVNAAVVYRNSGHVTETFSRTLVPTLGDRLGAALAARPTPPPTPTP